MSLNIIPLFIRYFFTVVDPHSLQAPFVFDFYSRLLNAIQKNPGLVAIENLRRELLRDHSLVAGHDFGAGSKVGSKERTIASIAKSGISSRKDCVFLYELIQLARPDTIVELGTSLGIATAYMSKAVGQGRVFTFEGNELLVARAMTILNKLECNNVEIIRGNIDSELPVLLGQIEMVDFAVIDANHTKMALLHYFNSIKRKMTKGGIMLIDDIRWSKEMYEGWQEIVSNPQVSLSMEFLNKGVVFVELNIPKQHYVLSY